MFEIGTSLREARNRQQLDLTEVEQATKIRARYLQALEEESFDALPAQTYVKGFLRTYADYLGLDGQLYVDEYNSRYAVGADDEFREPVVARRSSRVQPRHRRLERRGVVLALAGIGVLCALVIAAFKFSSDNAEPRIPNLSTNGVAPKPPPPPARAQRKRTPTPPAKLRFFVVATNGNCWMDVRNYSSSGKTLFTGTIEPGHGQFFKARRLWINFGNPGNVKASLNGHVVAIPGGGTSAIVLVTRRGIIPSSTA